MFMKSPSTDLIIVLVIILLIFGPKRLPGLGRQLGQGMREFKDSITGNDKGDESSRPEITAASASASTPEAAVGAPAQRQSAPAQRPSAEVGPHPSA